MKQCNDCKRELLLEFVDAVSKMNWEKHINWDAVVEKGVTLREMITKIRSGYYL